MSALGKRKSDGCGSQRPAKRMTSEEARYQLNEAGHDALRAATDAVVASEAGLKLVEAVADRMVAAAEKALRAAQAMGLLLDEVRANDAKLEHEKEANKGQDENDEDEKREKRVENEKQEEKGTNLAVRCPRCRVQNIVPEGIRASSKAVSEMFQCGKCDQCMCLDIIKSEC